MLIIFNFREITLESRVSAPLAKVSLFTHEALDRASITFMSANVKMIGMLSYHIAAYVIETLLLFDRLRHFVLVLNVVGSYRMAPKNASRVSGIPAACQTKRDR